MYRFLSLSLFFSFLSFFSFFFLRTDDAENIASDRRTKEAKAKQSKAKQQQQQQQKPSTIYIYAFARCYSVVNFFNNGIAFTSAQANVSGKVNVTAYSSEARNRIYDKHENTREFSFIKHHFSISSRRLPAIRRINLT